MNDFLIKPQDGNNYERSTSRDEITDPIFLINKDQISRDRHTPLISLSYSILEITRQDRQPPNFTQPLSFEEFLPRDKLYISISNQNISTSSNLELLKTYNSELGSRSLFPGNASSFLSKEVPQFTSTSSPKQGTVPTHLKLLPPIIPIPYGYKWIFIHGGWILIPSINFYKFYTQDP